MDERVQVYAAHQPRELAVLAFGVNVLDNPLYPWVARRLLTDAPEGERVEQTLDALRLYVQHMIEHFEKGG